jgi:hypothetical protein
LGTAIPRRYRDVLRQQGFLKKYPLSELEQLLIIPSEFIEFVLSDEFEVEFEAALEGC